MASARWRLVSDSTEEVNSGGKQSQAFSANERRVLAALCVGTFIGLLTFVAPTPFLPAMALELDASVPLLGQVVAAMLLISAVLGLVAGPIADRYGPPEPIPDPKATEYGSGDIHCRSTLAMDSDSRTD